MHVSFDVGDAENVREWINMEIYQGNNFENIGVGGGENAAKKSGKRSRKGLSISNEKRSGLKTKRKALGDISNSSKASSGFGNKGKPIGGPAKALEKSALKSNRKPLGNISNNSNVSLQSIPISKTTFVTEVRKATTNPSKITTTNPHKLNLDTENDYELDFCNRQASSHEPHPDLADDCLNINQFITNSKIIGALNVNSFKLYSNLPLGSSKKNQPLDFIPEIAESKFPISSRASQNSLAFEDEEDDLWSAEMNIDVALDDEGLWD